MLNSGEDFRPERLTPDTCQNLFQESQRRSRSESVFRSPDGLTFTIQASKGRLRISNSSEETRQYWEPTLRALARGWPPTQCVSDGLQRNMENCGTSQEDLLLGVIRKLAHAELTWQKRAWLTGLCYHSRNTIIATEARGLLAEGDLGGLLKWQLLDNVTLLDTFYMSWHEAWGQWNFFDDNFGDWEKDIKQFIPAWRPENPANVFLEISLQGKKYFVEIIVGRQLVGSGTTLLGANKLEPSRFIQAFTGIKLPTHYEWARFSTQPFAATLTPLSRLRQAAAKLTEHIERCWTSGYSCTLCKATGGIERCGVMMVDLTVGPSLPEKEFMTQIHPTEMPICPLCETRHCNACIVACRNRHESVEAMAQAAQAQVHEIQRLNDEARYHKEQRRAGQMDAAAVQPPLRPEATEPEPTISKTAQRRREKRTKQLQAALRLETRSHEREEEENRKIRQQVERLKLTEDTAVQQSLAGLACVGEPLPPRGPPAPPAKPVPHPLAAEVKQQLLENTQRGSRLRKEITAFVAAYAGPGLAPVNDGRAFSELLAGKLLRGQTSDFGDGCDSTTNEEVFGAFADSFCDHHWEDKCLRPGRQVVIRAAVAAERALAP